MSMLCSRLTIQTALLTLDEVWLQGGAQGGHSQMACSSQMGLELPKRQASSAGVRTRPYQRGRTSQFCRHGHDVVGGQLLTCQGVRSDGSWLVRCVTRTKFQTNLRTFNCTYVQYGIGVKDLGAATVSVTVSGVCCC
jgi:hypothetical protein